VDKISFIDRLSATGLAKIEITSFVSPKAVPNLRDAEAVARGIGRRPDVTYVALVPNERGCERALACGIDEINLVLSVSETHNQANMRMSPTDSLTAFRGVMQQARGTSTRVNGSIATAFGCPYEGPQPVEKVLAIARAYRDLGMHSITLADTTGMADPVQVAELTQRMLRKFPGWPLALHFHNTRGMGLANVLAAMSVGAERFEGALGGLGGCPFAPGATGNVCTEDVAHMLYACGIKTGINLDSLIALARDLPVLLGHDVPGQVLKAGKRDRKFRSAIAP
jgi:hydroxymethylglutaryl-CoA lyase